MKQWSTKSSPYRYWYAGFIGLCFAGLSLLSGCSAAPGGVTMADTREAVEVGVVKVARQDLENDFKISAEFRPYQEINVYAKVAGYVKEIYVDYGSRVKAGQVLAVLEVPELDDELAQAEANARQAEAEVTRAEEDLRSAESVHMVAHLAYTRLEGVMKTRPGLVAQQDVDTAQGKDLETEAQISSKKAALVAAQRRLDVARANQKRVGDLLDYTRITAPFAGVVTTRFADKGSMIQQGTSSQTQAEPLVRLGQNDILRLVLPVPESVVSRVKLGQAVDVNVPSLNRSFTGHVSRFADQLDMETRTMHTEVDVKNEDNTLFPGMYAQADLLLERREASLSVPLLAVSRAGGRTTVCAVTAENRVQTRTVQLGLQTSNVAEIRSGLNEGDLVVISDRTELKDGLPVRPKLVEAVASAGDR